MNGKEANINKDFHYSRGPLILALKTSYKLLKQHEADVNKLNVFPVPDGDTGTNMALTLSSVINHLEQLDSNPSVSEIRNAVSTGALLGARGNSGVILSQILRGLCEGYEDHELFDTQGLASAFTRAEEVAFASVRKPIRGTILTVLEDSAKASRFAYRKKLKIDKAVTYVSARAYESVENTPNLLPVLKENNVVDAGGYGLAIFIEGIAKTLTGIAGQMSRDLNNNSNIKPKVKIEQINDWEGSKYKYCNEFLVDSNSLDTNEALNFLQSIGDCELCVGSAPKFKVHVHSNNPDRVLKYFLERGQISEVFIHNMELQSIQRNDSLNKSNIQKNKVKSNTTKKNIGIVAVACGQGNIDNLYNLGVDVVISGGQTMNPSIKDLSDAAKQTNAENVIFLPNNKNIILAAKSAGPVCGCNSYVVQTKNIPSAITAMINFDPSLDFETNCRNLNSAIEDVLCGEITKAIKDSKDKFGQNIKKDDFIGIFNDEIYTSDKSILSAFKNLIKNFELENADVLTIIRGEDITEDELSILVKSIEHEYPNIEVDTIWGGQPLYPIIFSVE